MAGAVALIVTALSLVGPAPNGAVAGTTDQVLDAATIHDEQVAVVDRNDQVPIQAARAAMQLLEADISRRHEAIAGETAAEAAATVAHQTAIAQLASDTTAAGDARLAVQDAQGRVDGDRGRIRALAVGTYTGEFTNPQPSGSPTPQADQQAAIDIAEVKVVAGIVDRRLRSDLSSLSSATRERDRLVAAVGSDQKSIADTAQAAQSAASMLQLDNQTLGSDESQLGAAGQQLAHAQAQLTADLASLASPPGAPAGAVSLLGGPALTASELASWFHWAGYVDFTSAPIQQLAAWYIQSGREEGVRGDVAFAQAILETGGFSSPDATDFNNYAGIGHCDSCASGWQFPSPTGGVLGQVQLLRIFATTAPPPSGAPGPVLASLTVSSQHEAGCCPSVEALTGVWATDPTYDSQILGIYHQILEYALSVH